MSYLTQEICIVCNKRVQVSKGLDRRGRRLYRTRCSVCKTKPWKIHRKDYCEQCGFVAEHSCQLDQHHIDEDKKNNDLDNLMTLCANCHRLVHFS